MHCTKHSIVSFFAAAEAFSCGIYVSSFSKVFAYSSHDYDEFY